jgi:hypothetical protein
MQKWASVGLSPEIPKAGDDSTSRFCFGLHAGYAAEGRLDLGDQNFFADFSARGQVGG